MPLAEELRAKLRALGNFVPTGEWPRGHRSDNELVAEVEKLEKAQERWERFKEEILFNLNRRQPYLVGEVYDALYKRMAQLEEGESDVPR